MQAIVFQTRSHYRNKRGLPRCAIAFGLITEIGGIGRRESVRNTIHLNGTYCTGELDFLILIEAAFLDQFGLKLSQQNHDSFTTSQITTCLDPAELNKFSQTLNACRYPGGILIRYS